MDYGNLYDPPLNQPRTRGRSASFSASAAAPPQPKPSLSRRQSLSSLATQTAPPAYGNLSDEEASPLVDLGHQTDFAISGPSPQAPVDAAADRKIQRDGRQSKATMQAQNPKAGPMTSDMEGFMAQLFDLTHAIDALENDVDEIVELRNKIVKLDPKVDIGQVSLRSDLDSLSSLTTQTGKAIVGLEQWLLQLHTWSKQVKALVKAGKAGETLKEVGEIKFHLASAKMDFADAMERIREGAYKEQERRERTRIWMARHIRSREPDIDDKDVRGLLKASELGAADGVAHSDVTSYAGLWALQNPFSELAELTNGMRFLEDDLDREIVDAATGKSAKKRTIYLNGAPHSSKKSRSSKKPSSSSRPKKSSKKSSSAHQPQPTWLGLHGYVPSFVGGSQRRSGSGRMTAEQKYRQIEAQQYAAEKDLEYGFARQEELSRVNRRKKLIIGLLVIIIIALIIFVVLATMKVPNSNVAITTYPSSDAAGATTSSQASFNPQMESFSTDLATSSAQSTTSSAATSEASHRSSASSTFSGLSASSAASASSGSSAGHVIYSNAAFSTGAATTTQPSWMTGFEQNPTTSSAAAVTFNNGLWQATTQTTVASAVQSTVGVMGQVVQ